MSNNQVKFILIKIGYSLKKKNSNSDVVKIITAIHRDRYNSILSDEELKRVFSRIL